MRQGSHRAATHQSSSQVVASAGSSNERAAHRTCLIAKRGETRSSFSESFLAADDKPALTCGHLAPTRADAPHVLPLERLLSTASSRDLSGIWRCDDRLDPHRCPRAPADERSLDRPVTSSPVASARRTVDGHSPPTSGGSRALVDARRDRDCSRVCPGMVDQRKNQSTPSARAGHLPHRRLRRWRSLQPGRRGRLSDSRLTGSPPLMARSALTANEHRTCPLLRRSNSPTRTRFAALGQASARGWPSTASNLRPRLDDPRPRFAPGHGFKGPQTSPGGGATIER